MAGLIAPDELFGDVIFSYTLDDALADGVLAKLWEEKWPVLSEGKPIVATHAVTETLTNEQLVEVWNEYAIWHQKARLCLPVSERIFKTQIAGETVWVEESGESHCVMFAEDM